MRRRIAPYYTREYREDKHHRNTITQEQMHNCKKAAGPFTALLNTEKSSNLRVHQRIHTGEKALKCKAKLANSIQEHSLTGGQVPYSKEQEEITRKLFGLSNPTITNDTQVSLNTSDGDRGELAAATEIPERADEEGTEVNTSQECGMEEGGECPEAKMSDLEGNVGELKLNIVACVKEEACDDPAAVVEGGRLEPLGGEEPEALGAEAPPSPRAHRQYQAFAAGEKNKKDLKPECLYQEQVQSTESYQATSNLLQQTSTEFKMDVSQNLQRDNEILQHHLQRDNEILQQHLQRNNEILQHQLQRNNEILQQHLQRNNEILQHQLQRNNGILQQQNENLCQLLQ
ncbi:hypothetical protein scyTo_0006081 [Scyliorhinus torazame]|uniref:C2H2-type domain-containing protein n=1 Tax=Scyliorhinus torazame TaxID=75743 RepID=A0A401PFB9_SCYTO|nr:hypothetical protein [Scyliorhinus torazame]